MKDVELLLSLVPSVEAFALPEPDKNEATQSPRRYGYAQSPRMEIRGLD